MTRTQLKPPQIGNEWWEELGRTTLGAGGSTITVNNLTARKYLKILVRVFNSGALSNQLRFNNDSGANYVYRISSNGTADTVSGAVTGIFGDAGSYNVSGIFEIFNNLAASEKSVYARTIAENTAGVANTPGRSEVSAKWVNTSAQITRVDYVNTGAGSFLAGSEVIVLGHD